MTKKYKSKWHEGKSVLLARHLMAEHLERQLTKAEIVHHINGDTNDNRIENLQVMTRKEHAKIHLYKGGRQKPYQEYYQENRERILANNKRSYQKHREKILEQKKEYYTKNKERILEGKRVTYRRKKEEQERNGK